MPSSSPLPAIVSTETYTSNGRSFRFNDPVYAEMVLGPIEQRSGRLVQVRKGVGAFGMDVYLIRRRDGSLSTFENVMLCKVGDPVFEKAFYESNGRKAPVIPEQPVYPPDSVESEYSILGQWPEVGFVISHPKQPESTQHSFALIVHMEKAAGTAAAIQGEQR